MHLENSNSENSNSENNKPISALEKIAALKQEKESKRIETENQIHSQHQTENEKLLEIASLKEEVLKRLSEIKVQRENIIKSGQNAISEARQDEDIENTVHTKEGFNDIFSSEKAEWKGLQEEVVSLGQELEKLNALAPEKEKEVEKLFLQTKEGKEQILKKEKNEAKQFLNEDYFSVSRIENGTFDWNLIKAHHILKLPQEEQDTIISNVKSILNEKISKHFDQENEKNGINSIGKDLDSVEAFKKERDEVINGLREFRAQAEGFLEQYTHLFESHKEADEIIGRYFGNEGERRNTILAYLYERHKNDGVHNEYLSGLMQKLQEPIGVGATFPKLQPIKEYIEKAKIKNEKLIALIESDDIETIKELYSGVQSGPKQEAFFGFSEYSVTKNLVNNYPEEIIKSEASKKTKLSLGKLEDYYTKQVEEQKYREKIATELSDAGVDMILWRERAGEFSTTPKDILFQEQQADKLRTTAENQLSFGEIHRGIMELEKDKAERIVLSVPEVGLTFEAPLFESKAKELIKATNKVKDLQARLNLEKSEQTFLRNKKLGLFESRKNHEDVLRKISSTITNIESGLVDATTSQKEYLNTPNQAIEMLWAGLNKINSTSKKAELLGLTEKMTVGELIEKVEMYVSSIANQELYPDEKKRHISEGYADAEKRFTIAKSEMASLVKK